MQRRYAPGAVGSNRSSWPRWSGSSGSSFATRSRRCSARTLGETYGVSRTRARDGVHRVHARLRGGAVPPGLLADRRGSVRILVAGSLVTAAGALVLVVDSPFAVLAAGMLPDRRGDGRLQDRRRAPPLADLSGPDRARARRVRHVRDVRQRRRARGGGGRRRASPMFGAPWRTLFLAGGLASVGLAVAVAVRVPRYLRGRDRRRRADGGETGQRRPTIAALRRRRFGPTSRCSGDRGSPPSSR